MEPSAQCPNLAWVDQCPCLMSKNVTPLRNGDAKGWILRGGFPESQLQMDQEKEGMWVLGQTDLKFQSLIHFAVNISDR